MRITQMNLNEVENEHLLRLCNIVRGWDPKVHATIQMIAIGQYFPMVIFNFIMLYKVILTLDSVDEILKCDHSNERYGAVLSNGDA